MLHRRFKQRKIKWKPGFTMDILCKQNLWDHRPSQMVIASSSATFWPSVCPARILWHLLKSQWWRTCRLNAWHPITHSHTPASTVSACFTWSWVASPSFSRAWSPMPPTQTKKGGDLIEEATSSTLVSTNNNNVVLLLEKVLKQTWIQDIFSRLPAVVPDDESKQTN